ncbi:MAG: STAS domain-containing protein [Deltaproteobacteria bacterium]|nr:STAS domain-containing protein [Deltaproteobacteria bacterium]
MLQFQEYQDVAVIDLKGDVGPQEVEKVGKTLFSLLRKRRSKVVLNFQQVDHVHYPSIRPLIEVVSKLKRLRADLKFAGMSSYTQSIFEFVGAQEFVESFESVPKAVLSFRSDWRTWH